jgi:hypothetical protein
MTTKISTRRAPTRAKPKHPTPTIRFATPLLTPRTESPKPPTWSFLTLPKPATRKLPSRGQVSISGTLNDHPFQATLQPDGQGGHWLKIDRKLREAAGIAPGDTVTLEISPAAKEPEPKIPADLRKALAAARGPVGDKARQAWSDITPAARRDFIHWITSAKQQETRARRTAAACDMLAKGKRRPCCFDRSGMYGNSLSCPVVEA